jgi:hypothetical protein
MVPEPTFATSAHRPNSTAWPASSSGSPALSATAAASDARLADGSGTWKPIRYPRAIWDDQLRCWVSDAQVTEIKYTAFASKMGQAITARLIVRRVRDLTKQAAAGQDELFPAWRYHAVFTDSSADLVQAEDQHRDHAVVEQVFADWRDGPLAHLPYQGSSRPTPPG